jgi:hypothetical protein
LSRRRAERTIGQALRPGSKELGKTGAQKRSVETLVIGDVIKEQAELGRTQADLLRSSQEAWMHAIGQASGPAKPAKRGRKETYKPTQELASFSPGLSLLATGGGGIM